MVATQNETIRVAHFQGVNGREPAHHAYPWDQFWSHMLTLNTGDFVEFNAKSKEEIPWLYSPAEFQGLRAKKNVLRINFLCLDFDGPKGRGYLTLEESQSVWQRLKAFDTICHSSISHPKKGPFRFRVIFRLDRPVMAREWQLFWRNISDLFPERDMQCSDVSRMYFPAVISPGTRDKHFVFTTDGGPLKVDEFLKSKNLSRREDAPITKDQLIELAKRVKRSKDQKRAETGHSLERAIKGEMFAAKGETNDTMFWMSRELAKAFTDTQPEAFAPHFHQAFEMIQRHHPDPESLDTFIKQIRRAQDHILEDRNAKSENDHTDHQRALTRAFGYSRTQPYTDEELSSIYLRLGCNEEEMRKRWILVHKTQYFVFTPRGYENFNRSSALEAAHQYLIAAESAGVILFEVSALGDQIDKSLTRLIKDYGTVVSEYEYDLTIPQSIFESDRSLYRKACTPLRPLDPEYHQGIQDWLGLLTTSHPEFKLLMQWLYFVTDLSRPCSALFLTGPGNVGKSLLAAGLARLWRIGPPSDLGQVLSGNWNDQITRCPLLFGDEGLPADSTQELRFLIQAREFPISEKYQPQIICRGSVRLMIAANSSSALNLQKDLTREDVHAIHERILILNVGDPAREYLSNQDTHDWIKNDRIAKHALWIRQNHECRPEGRFLVKPANMDRFYDLGIRSGRKSDVCQWLTQFLINPTPVNATGGHAYCFVYEGKLLVNSQVINQSWAHYCQSICPSLHQIGRTLSDLSGGSRTERNRIKFYQIDPNYLIAWAESSGYCTQEMIEEKLNERTHTG